MPLRETLVRILNEYPAAKHEASKGHPLGNFLRHDAEDAVADGLGEFAAGRIVEGSAGKGPWAAVPWISVFDPAVTTSATAGYYVVYLFHVSEPIVHLSLNQGTTAVHDEFGRSTRAVLRDRAEFMRKRVADFQPGLPIMDINLGSNVGLPGDYMAGHALGVTYSLETLPIARRSAAHCTGLSGADVSRRHRGRCRAAGRAGGRI